MDKEKKRIEDIFTLTNPFNAKMLTYFEGLQKLYDLQNEVRKEYFKRLEEIEKEKTKIDC